MMWKLQLPLRQKIGVAGILTMGGFVCIVSIIRLQSLYVLLKGTELTVDTVNALLWCVVELNISIIGGCAPTLRPFLQRYFPSLLGSSSALYGTGELHHGRSRQGQSHQLRSFDPSSSITTKTGTTRVMIRTVGENESEEYIIQHGNGSEADSQLGKITKTVEFGYEEVANPEDRRLPRGRD
ncbi:hypothetical protein VE04_07937 [Pseudogymnoascus sp. 24MN13]|nr:hypothetical protein VE04_07937 [Pseudogymnoascus sp. 24MN13]